MPLLCPVLPIFAASSQKGGWWCDFHWQWMEAMMSDQKQQEVLCSAFCVPFPLNGCFRYFTFPSARVVGTLLSSLPLF